MPCRHWISFIAVLVVQVFAAPPIQVPLTSSEHDSSSTHSIAAGAAEKPRQLHGRFLQITDFHPDPFYEVYSSTSKDAACHRGQGPAGIYGAETSECDSPFSLVNKTMEWVAKNLKDQIDFVLWTGDSARHDNDDDLPRSHEQVLNLNKFLVSKMAEVFGKHNGDEEDDDPTNDFIIPIIPNLGNNDILPHNILDAGPNDWTRTYSKVWRQFIPEEQRHQFEQGGWFYVEVIPHKLAVFSLNTLYFFASNSLAEGCAAHSEPGYQQMEWLRIQLQFMRQRGMKAILIGHVPPIRQEAKTTWDETCWQKYALWTRQYRDVIVSTHYGHFNYDHFLFQDFEEIDDDTKDGHMKASYMQKLDEGDVEVALSKSYWTDLRHEWSQIPKPPKAKGWLDFLSGGRGQQAKRDKYYRHIGGEFAERFSASFVSASVVPNLFPTLRVFEYNITGLDGEALSASPIPAPASIPEVVSIAKDRQYKFVVPEPPSTTAPPGPAYSPQTFSLLKFTQYFANLTVINNDFVSSSDDHEVDAEKWNEGKHKGKKPHERDHTPSPKKFEFKVLYDTQDDKIYRLKDLTMPNMIDLARRIGNFVAEKAEPASRGDEDRIADEVDHAATTKKKKKHKKKKHKKEKKHRKANAAWYAFVSRAYVDTMDPDDLEEEFGR